MSPSNTNAVTRYRSRRASNTGVAFNKLPAELTQMIADNLGDEDLRAFNATCVATYGPLQDPTFWRVRFLGTFDDPRQTGQLLPRAGWQKAYQVRQAYLSPPTRFNANAAADNNQTMLIHALRAVITQATPKSSNGGSKNLQRLAEFAQTSPTMAELYMMPSERQMSSHPAVNSSAVRNVKRDYYAVILCLASHLLSLNWFTGCSIYGFPESQKFVYASVAQAPVFDANGSVNLEWCAHVLNFFRMHITDNKHQTLYNSYSHLNDDEIPQMTNQKLTNDMPLAKVWKGSYAFIDRDECDRSRQLKPRTEDYADQNLDNEEPIQTMKLFRPSSQRCNDFNHAIFEHVLNSFGTSSAILPPQSQPQHFGPGPARQQPQHFGPPRAKKMHHAGSYPIEGLGWDDEEFYCTGYVNPLPPQRGIPGWKRMTMMKYFIDQWGQINTGALWAYEGVVLPGSQMVLGRWWSHEGVPLDQQYSGPFILWGVDASWDPTEAAWCGDHRGLAPA
ncbi:hypothetical protein BT63DRAFT_415336 [Microthyrium microscopicum]|uniref:F-box domain-containing protein n=1 Tax=Microthyrium microscopicum TaxID=703497 RepID=A0A6A6U845_9PEZI|nr:hypothetical protein BT63DRAFT_415336 [Microthyrium microscopicum]